jgi:glycosyltransferase involved in cell wall biosynthesis
MRERRRVCFVLPSLNGGGAERAAVQILNALDEARWDRSMYLFRREGPYLRDVAPSVRIASGESATRIGRLRGLRRFIQATRPDIVVSFLSYFSVLVAARLARIGCRVIFNQQTPMSAFLTDRDYHWRRPADRRLFQIATRIGYRLADLIVTTSRGVADDLARSFGVEADRIRIVHNPVDLESIARSVRESIPPEHQSQWTCPVVVAAGRLAEAKNFPLLIEAVAALRTRVPLHLFILGAGDQEEALVKLAAERGVAASIVFCGFQSNPWKYIARADIFALSSRYGGFGNVLVEAMACGVPVVATTSPGTTEIVADGVDGLLVEHHDAMSFAAALERVLTDRSLRQRLSEAARRKAQQFALGTVAADYSRVFEEALA